MKRVLDDQPPDPFRAITRYRAHAEGYDASAQRTMPLRRRTIRALSLTPGDSVLDVACGTGLSFPLLAAAVGPRGRVTGVELSPDMASRARARIAATGWSHVTLIESAVEDATLTGPFDAVLFNFTHDVLQSPAALARVFSAARPGARVAAAGSRLFPAWLAPVNAVVRGINAPYVTTLAGMRRPWRHLADYVSDLRVRPALWGAGYVAWGRYAATGPDLSGAYRPNESGPTA
jgi:demethylmenaquinone methyltransferase/2-methoxy-6-polyprenyl-1,4-benzoquinol methylase